MYIDKVIVSNKVLRESSDHLVPAAIAISGSRIHAVGDAEDIIRIAKESNGPGINAQILDYRDACVYPGFHDAHMHVFHSALYSSSLAASFLGDNEQDCVCRMKEFSVTRKDGWLLAQGWREYRWDIPELPTKLSLDAAFPDRPVALYSGDAHTLWLNSVALRELGIGEDSIPPEGGYYGRFDNGDLTGIVGEAAAMQLMPKIVASFSDQEMLDAYRGFLAELARLGVTALCDMSLMPGNGMDFIRDDIYSALLRNGDLATRISMFPTLRDDMSRIERMCETQKDPLLLACGFKQFFDGVSSQHTAWLHDDYSNARRKGDRGMPSIDPEEMQRLVLNANSKGLPVRIHAIGDEAVRSALDIFEKSNRYYGALPNGRRNCIEHLENLQPEDIARFAKLDVIASVQPAHITLDPGGPERDLGSERIPYMWPFAALLDTGATLAFGTDSPVVAADPLDNLFTAIAREDAGTHEPSGGWLPSEKISRLQALRAYTQGSACAAQRKRDMGSIQCGHFADLAVLDKDLIECDIDEIQETEVIATYVGGREAFSR